jgi:hypothetical protein
MSNNASVYADLCRIYENSLIGEPDFPRAVTGQRPYVQSKVSYSKGNLPGQSPGQGQPTAIGIPVESEEDKMIPWSLVQSKITECLNNIEPGMTYAERMLQQLLIDLKPKYNI